MSNDNFAFPNSLYLPIKPENIRKISDPNGKVETFFALCPVEKVLEIPVDNTNPREQNLKSNVAKAIKGGLLQLDGNFHLLNRGITLSVASASYDNKTERLRLDFENSGVHGNVDGGHTQRVIRETVGTADWENARQKLIEIGEEIKPQFVKYEVISGLSSELLVKLAESRNTSVQVKDFSLDNLQGKFNWLKKELKDFEGVIAYKENEKKPVNIRDVISILTLFNTGLYPNNGPQYPTIAYSSKARPLEMFDKDEETYKALRPILKDVLILYDFVRAEMKDIFNRDGGKFMGWASVVDDSWTHFYFDETTEAVDYKVADGMVYPLLGAFRFLIKESKGECIWKIDDVRKFYERFGGKLIRTALEGVRGRGNNPNAAGKDPTLWAQLHDQVKIAYMELRDIDDDEYVKV